MEMVNDVYKMKGMPVAIDLKKHNQPKRKLNIPKELVPIKNDDTNLIYEIVAKIGETDILDGKKTMTSGYNTSILGPVIRLRKGQQTRLIAKNQLNESTTFHWHGLEVAAANDGGPHHEIMPGQEEILEFNVIQEAGTLWLHPHPHKKTAKQVYEGLAALIYVEDDNSDQLLIPKDYGIDDIPLIIQDKTFTDDGQLDYQADYQADGTLGDTSLINGTINPYVDLTKGLTRLRLLNGSNSRNYRISFSDNIPFKQIATDGGFLESPVELTELILTPAERAEIVMDTRQLAVGDTISMLNGDHALIEFNQVAMPIVTNELPTTLNSIKRLSDEEVAKLPMKEFRLAGMGETVTINNEKFDMSVINFETKLQSPEVWRIINEPSMMGGMIHPFHVHGTQFQILSRNGTPVSGADKGWKDTVGLLPKETVELLIEFKVPGVFMYHCHNLEHEDNGMMGQFLVK
ncbi:multicopper oxidase domain-containing protein [Vagococcus coleopterorum]|uniref:Multicopper oxidase domain-containing protein n=1 Tax=Vagococcus coleopterorum TaxID=2714946 RepID=A0A6G8APA4_9ENTE|nr:multicopper oxidase domain-containing protein [Vagococcus coleopterorum]QIL46799.1 multicopper oxidase domain-containing protein [Vagococcus coleopterorum]